MIELRNASYSYDGSRLVVDRVSLSLAPGERVVLLGLNGSGKSTLGRLLNGSLRPSEGSLSVDGESHDLARLVGYVRQDPRNQIVSAVVSDEVAFGPRNLGLSREEVLGRVDEALAACGIEGLRERMTSELSGGQQQLVSLAGVLAMHPRYVVLDEASSMLDRGMRRRVAGVVESLVARGVGVIEIAHSAEALSGASRILVMDEGRLVWEGEELPTGLAERLFGRPGPVPTSQGAVDASAHSLEACGVTLAYDELVALDDVSLVSRGLTLLVARTSSSATRSSRTSRSVRGRLASPTMLPSRPPVRRPECSVWTRTSSSVRPSRSRVGRCVALPWRALFPEVRRHTCSMSRRRGSTPPPVSSCARSCGTWFTRAQACW